MQDFHLVSSDEQIREILELSAMGDAQRVIYPIETALNVLKKEALTRYLIPTVPHIVTSLGTIHNLFEGLYESLGKEQFEKTIYEAGGRVGEAFGSELLRFLLERRRLPKDKNILLRIWTEFDTRAEWGQFIAETMESSTIVTITDSFLTRGREQDKHRYCDFMRGYIFGLLWFSFKEHYRWFSRAVTRPAEPPVEPVRITENRATDICRFTVALQEEELWEAFDLYSTARHEYHQQAYVQAATTLRSCLEYAFKSKVGIDASSRLSLQQLVERYKRANIPHLQIDFPAVIEMYQKTSTITHRTAAVAKSDIESLMFNVGRTLKQLELAVIGKERKETIRTV